LSVPALASLTLSTSADRDTFVIFESDETGLAGRNGREIAAPTASQPRLEEGIFSFNTARIVSLLDYEYGYRQWTITSITVTMHSNYPSAGTQPNNPRFNMINSGFFSLNWLSNDSWNANTLMYYDLADYLPGVGNNMMETLGTYYYPANGQGSFTWTLALTSGFLADVMAGSEITIFGAPEDTTVGYLYNPGQILTITAEAAPVPVPPAFMLLGSGLAALGFAGRRTHSAVRWAEAVNRLHTLQGGK
jgi:hypothetical protein